MMGTHFFLIDFVVNNLAARTTSLDAKVLGHDLGGHVLLGLADAAEKFQVIRVGLDDVAKPVPTPVAIRQAQPGGLVFIVFFVKLLEVVNDHVALLVLLEFVVGQRG